MTAAASPANDAGAAAVPADAADVAGLRSLVPAAIVVAAVVFNPLLAVVNANVRPLTSHVVIACEVMIIAAAHLYALANFDRRMRLWYGYAAFLVAFALMRIYATGQIEPKFVRDLLMIPTFVVLGMLATRQRAIGCMILLQALVVAGIILEALSLTTYEALFKVKEYYINTRGMVSDEFTNEASGLFVSATRPDARFFPFFDQHRLSSIFLEPVSLGNFAIISVCFTVAFWPLLGAAVRWFMVLAIVLTMLACDGRAASISAAMILAAAALSRLQPRNVALLYLPLILAATLAVVTLADFKTGTDDFAGRLAHTQHWLAQMELAEYMGASGRFLPEAEDSGIIYLIITQSLAGLMMLWAIIVLGMNERSQVHSNFKNGICLYLALTMMISFSFVSIKTAAPMWFIYGFLAASGDFFRAGDTDGGRKPDAQAV